MLRFLAFAAEDVEASSCFGACREPIDPLRLRIPPPALEVKREDGPSSEVGEVGKLELSNFTLSTMDSGLEEIFCWSRNTVVLVTKAGLLLVSSLEAEVEAISATFLLGENVREDLRP